MSNGLVSLPGANGTSTTVTITRPGGHSTNVTVTIAAPPTLDHLDYTLSFTSATIGSSAPTGTVAKWQDSGETTPFTGSVTLGYASSNTGVATINSSGVITLVAAGSCTFTVTDSISTKTATTGTLTVSAGGGGPVGQAASALYLTAPFSSTAYSTATVTPSGSKSSALPLATHSGTMQWRAMSASTISGGPTSNFVQATGGGATQSALFAGWVSDPLSAQTIGSGTYTVKLGAYTESNSAYKVAPVLYVWRPSTDAVVGSRIYDSATGLGTATTSNTSTDGRVVTFTGSSVTCQDGDRLVLEVYFVGTGNDFIHVIYNGNTSATTDGGTPDISEIDFPSAIYLQPFGTIRVGPTGVQSSTGALPTVTVASDAEFRSKAMPNGYGTLWDSTQTTKKGGAGSGFYLDGSSLLGVDLMNVDTSVTFTDRDSVTRHTMHVIIRPTGGAPLDPSKDSIAASSFRPEGLAALPPGRAFRSWMHRQLVKFNPGFRMDCPNNATSTFNRGPALDDGAGSQSGAYKIGVHPTNAGTRADFELSGGQNPGSEYLTGNFGTAGTTPSSGTTDNNNFIVGTLSTIMPNWNTNGDTWEIVRVQRVNLDGTATQAVYIGKVTDTTLTKVHVATTTPSGGSFPAMTAIGIVGKNFNRQLASTDTAPELWVSDAEFADITDPNWSWPSQIASGDRI